MDNVPVGPDTFDCGQRGDLEARYILAVEPKAGEFRARREEQSGELFETRDIVPVVPDHFMQCLTFVPHQIEEFASRLAVTKLRHQAAEPIAERLDRTFSVGGQTFCPPPSQAFFRY